MRLVDEGDFLYVYASYGEKATLESLGGTWNDKRKAYRFPRNLRCVEQITEIYKWHFNTDELKQKLQESQIQLLGKRKAPKYDHPYLRPYQQDDVHYLASIKSGGIFNEPRTGKTVTAITLLQRFESRNGSLIICPASLVWNWSAEFTKFVDGKFNIFVVQGTPSKKASIVQEFMRYSGDKVLIISKDAWKQDPVSYQFDCCFVDEAHYLRNHKSAQSKAVFKVKADHRFALTGTPTVKHATDIWGILHFLYPKKFTGFWAFANRYFNVTTNYFGHQEIGNVLVDREDELKEIVGMLSVQRKRKEVMQWLPKKQYVTHYVEMGKKQRKMYEQMAEDFLVTVDNEVVLDTANVLAQMTRMRQILLDPSLVGLEADSGKTEALLEWLEDNNEPVVIMSMFTSYLNKLYDVFSQKGYKVGQINGQMSAKEKQESAVAFQKGTIDVLLCNIISAGTGFTLDRAETIIFTDKAWNPAENQQAEDRITPTTEENNHSHTIISFVCKESFDESLEGLLRNKKSITDVINEGGSKAIKDMIRRTIK